MTKARMEDKKIWEVLVEAKKILGENFDDCYGININKERYICHCISAIYGRNLYNSRNRNTPAHKLIKEKLGRKNCIESWLSKNVPSFNDDLSQTGIDRFEQIQKYRHRWLNALIKECKEKNL